MTGSERRLINRRHFLLSAILGGPLMAGFIAAFNLWLLRRYTKAVLYVFLGLLLNLILEACLWAFADLILIPSGLYAGVWMGFILVIATQWLFWLIIRMMIRIKKTENIIFPGNHLYYPKKQAVPIVLLSLAYLFVHITIPMLGAYFPNMILVFYLIPQFYFYRKVKSVFSSQRLVIIMRWLIIAIACYMPVVFASGTYLRDVMPDKLMYFAEFYIYGVLYLFLLVLGLDILVFLIRKLRILPLDFIRHSITKSVTFIIIIACLVLILLLGNARYNNMVVNTYSVEIPGKSSKLDSIKICFVADMHLNNNTSHEFIDNYVNRIEKLDPDILLYGGDNLESGRISKEKLNEFDKKLSTINPEYGKFIVPGNHDPFRDNGYNEELDLIFLADTVLKVAESFYIMGVKYRSFDEKPIAELNKLITEDLPVILLDHSPYQFDAAYNNNIDIQLSGHTHYGQVWPINFVVSLMYVLPWGYKKIKDTHFFVTSGIQGWGTPIRTSGQSEIMEINVKFVK